MPLVSWQSCLAFGFALNHAAAFTGSQYTLTHEYSGANFFDGWDFYTGGDPTGGLVTYYSRSSSELTDLIKTSENGPAYMGVNYVDKIPFDNATGYVGAGRPSVRIASKQAFTHGLFIGDFAHIPDGICGTWPAFWTLGPNWPYTGEIDILEGVNQNMNNVMSLHTSETCIIEGNNTVMTGSLENTNCAYYPGYNVGCGVKDTRPTTFGKGFNAAGGGVYAMHWTSEYIRIWYWARANIPADVNSKNPDPGSWGLPSAQLGVGNCTIDDHFQSHKIIFDTTFCGEYAGNPYVWDSSDALSCKAATQMATCNEFVATKPEEFENAYWSVNYVRVYQLVDSGTGSSYSSYIASDRPAYSATYTAPTVAATPVLGEQLCPKYNYSLIVDGKYTYEIECGVDPAGPDITSGPPHPGFSASSLSDCVKGCSEYNDNNGPNFCGGAAYDELGKFCYFKKYMYGDMPKVRDNFAGVRLIFYGYPEITDDPRRPADSTFTSIFVSSSVTPQYYRPTTTTTTASITSSSSATTGGMTTSPTIAPPPLGNNVTSTSTLPSDYSETVTQSSRSSTSASSTEASTTTSSAPDTVASTNPEVTGAGNTFYIVFNIGSDLPRTRLAKRAIKYLSFNADGQSVLVDSEAEATQFFVDPSGNVKTAGNEKFVALDTTLSPPTFTTSVSLPATPAKVNVDSKGVVSFEGVNNYALLPDGKLAVQTEDGEPISGGQRLSPALVEVDNQSSSSTTRTTSMSSSSTASSINSSSSATRSSGGSTTLSVSICSMISSSGTRSQTSETSSSSSRSQVSTTGSTTRLPLRTTKTSSASATQSSTGKVINGYRYAGCFGVPDMTDFSSLPGIGLPYNDPQMTNDKCTARCKQLPNGYYAGTYDTTCICGTDALLYASLEQQLDASCNIPCPGANRDICGGKFDFQSSIPKRKRQASLILISLFNSTTLLSQDDDLASTTTGSITSAATSSSSTSLYFPPDQVSYNITGTNTATVISTTYVALCPTCPGGLTSQATTITVPHCGCTASYDHIAQTHVPIPSPTIPMFTTTAHCHCGENGAASTVTLMVPDTSSIAVLVAQVTVFAQTTAHESMDLPGLAGPIVHVANGTAAADAVQNTAQSAHGPGSANVTLQYPAAPVNGSRLVPIATFTSAATKVSVTDGLSLLWSEKRYVVGVVLGSAFAAIAFIW